MLHVVADEQTRVELTTQWQVHAGARFEQGTLVERANRAVQDAAA